MSPPVNLRVAPNRVLLILVLLLGVWLVFQFYPRKEKSAPPVTPVVTDSKLHAVGLADNADWEGLPELFAVWADHAGWKDDKAQFAYWDQGLRSYSYFFEAIRENGKVRFRSIPEPEIFEGSGSSYPTIYASEPGVIMVSNFDLKTESPEHPFVFFRPETAQKNYGGVWRKFRYYQSQTPILESKVNIDIKPAPLDLPKPERKAPSADGR